VIGFVKLSQRMAEASVKLDIFNNLATRLAAYKGPEQLFVIDKLPLNAMGEIDRKLLQAMAANQSEVTA